MGPTPTVQPSHTCLSTPAVWRNKDILGLTITPCLLSQIILHCYNFADEGSACTLLGPVILTS